MTVCSWCYQYRYEAQRAADDRRSIYGKGSEQPGHYVRWRTRKCQRCDGWKVKRETAPNRNRHREDAFSAQFRVAS